MNEREVELAVTGHVATLTLNRPDVLNALGWRLCEELIARAAEINGRRDIRAVILTGAGRAFCAGANLKERKTLEGPAKWELVKLINRAIHAIYDVEVPVIAAVNGHALGGGTELAAACDVRLAATEATFGCTEVKLGIIPGGGIVWLSRLIGMGKINELVLTGKRIRAEEAWAIGLVERVVPGSELLAEAQVLAQEIADNAPLAVKAAKKLTRLCFESPLAVSHELSAAIRQPLDYTSDMLEGLAAFAERRKPQFTGD